MEQPTMFPSQAPQVPSKELSKQQILQLLQKLKDMKQKGITKTNHDYIAIINLLKSQKNFQQIVTNARPTPSATTPSPGLISTPEPNDGNPLSPVVHSGPVSVPTNHPQEQYPIENTGANYTNSGASGNISGYTPSNLSNPGYPLTTAGYPPANAGYPPNNTGYAQNNAGYPPRASQQTNTAGYPSRTANTSGYPPNESGYPQNNGGYPSRPSQQLNTAGYPSRPSGYQPQNNAGYPSQSTNTGYPTNRPANVGYPTTVTSMPPPMPTQHSLLPIGPQSSNTQPDLHQNPSMNTNQPGYPQQQLLSTKPPQIPAVPSAQPLPPRQPMQIFTSPQIEQLKAQITAYKKIMNNMPLSQEHVDSCRGQFNVQMQMQQNAQNVQQHMHYGNHGQYQSQRPVPPAPLPVGQPRNTYPTPIPVVKPQRAPVNQPITQFTRKQTPVVPNISNTPSIGLPVLLSDREKRIRAKFASRLQELAKLNENEELSIKEQIEFEQLKLLGVQHKHRVDLLVYLREAINNKNNAKGSGRRKRTRGDKSRRKKQVQQSKQKEFLNSIVSHAKAFKSHFDSHAQKKKKVNRSMLTFHATKARREEQQRERAEKERLRALRENDEVAYLKLLEQTKNERLSQLLNQTDDYLNQIGAKVQEAKDKGAEQTKQETIQQHQKNLNEMSEDERKAFMAKEEEEAKQLQSTKAYYTIAHTIKEEITAQPEILVGGILKPYQLRGLQWLISLYNNNLNGVLADEMGLGKTIQTIALLTYLMETKGCNGPFLIIVPLSVLPNWQNELKIWAPSIVSVAYRGNAATRKSLYVNQLAHGKFNCALTTYDFVIRDKSYLSKIDWAYLIIDEGHRIKNANSKLTITLSKFYRSRYRLLLTGTPLQNSLPELWSLLNFLLPTIFNSVDNFQNWFSAPFASAGDRSDLTEEETALIIHRLHKVLRPFLLRRLKQEVEDQLPQKVEKVLRCDLSAMQKKLYDTMVNHGVVLCDPSKRSSTKGLNNTLMELRKVCNHPYLCNTNADYFINEDMIRCAGKFLTLDNLLRKMQATGHRVLIFSQMTEVMTILGDMLSFRGYQFLRLDGSTSSEDRGRLPDLFNDPNSPYFVFILSTRAGGQGLNLQAADTVIIFDSDWNPQMDLQAQDRAHRIGQKNAVRVFRLITVNSVEEDILDKANHKLDVDKKIIQAGMFNNRSSVTERREFLMKLLTEKEEEDMTEVPSAKAFNKMISRSEEEYVKFQAMDKEQERIREEKWREEGNSGDVPPLLMQEDELPEWLQIGHQEEEEDTTVYGRGMRQRSEVDYSDGGLINLNASVDEEHFESGELMEREEVLVVPEKTQKKRKPRSTSSSRKKRSRTTSSSRSAKKQKTGHDSELATSLLEIYNAVRYCQDEFERERSFLFRKLPSKRDYPDYYAIITTPIDLKTIKRRIKSEHYASVKEFQADMNLLFKNACTYNVESSQVYQDALCMKELCDYKIKELANE